MEEQKPKFDWKHLLITTAIVIVAAGAVGGTTYYVLNQNFQKERDANQKALDDVNAQLKAEEAKDKATTSATTTTTTVDSTANASSTTATSSSPKGTLSNTYRNNECAFSLKYPDGFKVTYNGAKNAMLSSAEFFGIDKGFTAYCSGGTIDLVTNFIGAIKGSNNYRSVRNSDGSWSYNIASNNGKLIIIKISDPNGTFTQANDILASLVRN